METLIAQMNTEEDAACFVKYFERESEVDQSVHEGYRKADGQMRRRDQKRDRKERKNQDILRVLPEH